MERQPSRNSVRVFAALAVAAIFLLDAVGIVACGSASGYRINVLLARRPGSRLKLAVDQVMDGDNAQIGGARVGQVSRVTRIILSEGLPVARVELTFDPSVKHLPVDTVVRVCPKAARRAAYLRLTPGSSPTQLPTDGTIPLSQVAAQPRC